MDRQAKSIHLVVMAGGVGERMWPWSRQRKPKQFQDFLGQGHSLLQSTIDRFQGLIKPTNIWIVTQMPYKRLVMKQLPWLKKERILLEPVTKNTAACIAYACQVIAQHDPAASLVITPADHQVKRVNLFTEAIQQALKSAQATNQLTLLGVPCIRPETGYGYIAFEQQEAAVKVVTQFIEKPAREAAISYMQAGNYAWNTGIVVGRLAAFIASYQTYLPNVWQAFREGLGHFQSKQVRIASQQLYQNLPAISFDQAILEKNKELYVVYQDFEWSDLGTWEALYEILPKDAHKNAIEGKTILLNSDRCLIKGDPKTLIAAYGVKDLVIVKQAGILLICPKEASQHIKALLKSLEEGLGEDYL